MSKASNQISLLQALRLAQFALDDLLIDGQRRQEPPDWLNELRRASRVIRAYIEQPAASDPTHDQPQKEIFERTLELFQKKRGSDKA